MRAQILLRVTPALKAAIERQAKDEGRSLNNLINRILEREVKK